MQRAERQRITGWKAFSFRLNGEVQQIGLRKHIISRAHSLGISGWIHNVTDNQEMVIGQFGCEKDRLEEFLDWLKVEMGGRNIEIVSGEIPLSKEDLPLPAARMPNTPMDTDARLDKGIELLVEMNETLKILHPMAADIKEINRKMDKSLNNQDIMIGNQEKMLGNQEITHQKLDKSLKNQEITHDKLDKSLKNQEEMIGNQKITHDKLDKSLKNQEITHDKLDKSLNNQEITHDKLDKLAESE